jgi:hypothetical protein
MLARYGTTTVRHRNSNPKTGANIRCFEAMLLFHESLDFAERLVLLHVQAEDGSFVLIPFLRHRNFSIKLSVDDRLPCGDVGLGSAS